MVERIIRTKKRKSTGIILAVFFNFFAWTYTWKFDKSKFWAAFILNFIGLFTGVFSIFIIMGTFLWCLIDMITKDNDIFKNYSQYIFESDVSSKKNVNFVNKNTQKVKKIESKKGIPTVVSVLLIIFVGLPVLFVIIALIVGMSSINYDYNSNISNSSVNNVVETSGSNSNEDVSDNLVISKENYNKISVGMTKNEVFNILGSDAIISESETPGVGKMEMYHYQKGFSTKAITITFINGEVYSKNWIDI
jgi:hypothetical protein